MQIVCPHCQTSYAVRADSIGAAGRTVRCARCKQTWLAMPVPEAESVGAEATAMEQQPAAAEHYAPSHDVDVVARVPDIESPSIAADMPDDAETASSPVVDVVATSIGTSRPLRTRR